VQISWALIVVFAVGCSKGAPVAAPIQPDAPAFGLYRLSKETLRPQLIAAMRADGVSEGRMKRDLAMLDPANAWLLLSRRSPPMLIHTLERPRARELTLSRHLRNFRLEFAGRKSSVSATCTAESDSELSCAVSVDRGMKKAVLKSRFERVRGPSSLKPAPGVYEEIAGQAPESNRAAITNTVKWLTDSGVSATDARAAADDAIGSDRYLVVDGKRHLLIEKTVSLITADVESQREVNVRWDASPLLRKPTRDGYELRVARQGGESMRCKTVEKGVRCSIGKRTTLWTPVE
jgi:hypothetical protein